MTIAVLNEVTVGPNGQHLPPWAQAYLDLGCSVATYQGEPEGRLLFAASLPTRAYAAVFIAAGIVLQNAITESTEDPYVHVEELVKAAGPQGRLQVNVIEGKKKVAGVFSGLVDDPTGRYLKIEIGQNETKLLPIERSLRVLPTARAKHQGRRQAIVRPGAEIIASLLGRSDTAQYLLTSRLECVMVGLRSLLSEEIKTPTLLFDGHQGCLQDILRVRSCMPVGDAYRSDIVSDRHAPSVGEETPYAVIFDGAPAFLKWRRDWRSVPWIVLLDRSETQFEDAARQVNSDYRNRVTDAQGLRLSSLPPGVEITAFEVRGR